MSAVNDDARRQPGVKTTQKTDFDADFATNVAGNQPAKPELDLASWSALGKHSRDRRQKKAWMWKAGGAR
ncbi:MAG: hypothetical protein Q8Q28_11175 [Pseudomonadota bacterium]|nr:hypothetical protein [Pseudomonadota bacterium]